MQGIVQMIVRMAIRNAIKVGMVFGINKGVDHLAERGNGGKPLSKEQRQQTNTSKKRMRQAMRLIRRIGRF